MRLLQACKLLLRPNGIMLNESQAGTGAIWAHWDPLVMSAWLEETGRDVCVPIRGAAEQLLGKWKLFGNFILQTGRLRPSL